jgi:hypothetical protein
MQSRIEDGMARPAGLPGRSILNRVQPRESISIHYLGPQIYERTALGDANDTVGAEGVEESTIGKAKEQARR